MRGSAVGVRGAVVLVAAALVVGGCSSTVEGEAFPVDVIGMFDPCEVLSNEELEKVGVDPATKEVDIVDTHIDGFNICSWNGEWYFLSLTSTDHSLVEVEQNPVMRDLHRAQIAGREVLKYQERNDKTDSACNVAFATSQSTAMIRVGAKVGVARPETPCTLVERIAETVIPLLP